MTRLRFWYTCEAEFRRECPRPVALVLPTGHLVCAECAAGLDVVGRIRPQLLPTCLPANLFGKEYQDRAIDKWVRQMRADRDRPGQFVLSDADDR